MSGKREYKCETCGKRFMQWPSQVAKRTFCSRECYAEALRGSTPHNKGKKTVASKPCAECGALIVGEPSQVKRRKYCSRECTAKAFSRDVIQTLEKYTSKPDGTDCWVWTGPKRGGYGRFKVAGNGYVSAHRASYEQHVGQIPEGLHLDHLCRNRACVNPQHLEPVTPAENIRRGDAGKGPRSKKHREALSAAGKRRYADPEERRKQAARLDEIRSDPKRVENLRIALQDKKYREGKSEEMKKIWAERKRQGWKRADR